MRLLTGMPIKDPTAGYVGYRREVLQAIALDEIRFVGYAFQIEMKFWSSAIEKNPCGVSHHIENRELEPKWMILFGKLFWSFIFTPKCVV